MGLQRKRDAVVAMATQCCPICVAVEHAINHLTLYWKKVKGLKRTFHFWINISGNYRHTFPPPLGHRYTRCQTPASLHWCSLAISGLNGPLALPPTWFGTALNVAELPRNAERVRDQFGIGPTQNPVSTDCGSDPSLELMNCRPSSLTSDWEQKQSLNGSDLFMQNQKPIL